MKALLSILMFLNVAFSTSRAQDNQWQITMSDGHVHRQLTLERVSGESFFVFDGIDTVRLSVESVNEVRFVRQSKAADGVRIGILVGAASGAIFGCVNANPHGTSGDWSLIDISDEQVRGPGKFLAAVLGGVLGSIFGMGIGAGAGAVMGIDTVYDLSAMPLNAKLSTLRSILREQQASTN